MALCVCVCMHIHESYVSCYAALNIHTYEYLHTMYNICIYRHIYIYTSIHTYDIQMFLRTYSPISTCMLTFLWCVCVFYTNHIHICPHTYVHAYMHTYLRACVHTYIYLHVHVYTWIHIYMHTYAHKHKYTLQVPWCT